MAATHNNFPPANSNAELTANVRLAGCLEMLARQHNAEYAEELIDWFPARDGSSDIGSDLLTEVNFEARRTWTDDYDEVSGIIYPRKIRLAEFFIGSMVRHRCPNFDSFPEDVRDYFRRDVGYKQRFLEDPSRQFAIAFKLDFYSTTEGIFESKHGLTYCIDDEELILLPDEETEEAGYLDTTADMEEAEQASELFHSIFQDDELASIRGLEQTFGDQPKGVLEMFSSVIPQVERTSHAERITMAERISKLAMRQPLSNDEMAN